MRGDPCTTAPQPRSGGGRRGEAALDANVRRSAAPPPGSPVLRHAVSRGSNASTRQLPPSATTTNAGPLAAASPPAVVGMACGPGYVPGLDGCGGAAGACG